MGFWPFGGGKRQRASEPTRHARNESLQSDPSENSRKRDKTSTDHEANTRTLARREENRSRRLSKIRTVSREKPLRSETAPTLNPSLRRHSRTIPPTIQKELYQQNLASQSSLGPENFSVVRQPPTLYARRYDNESSLTRRKSSKRKAEDHAREQEIRTMSTSPIPIPKRPTSFYDSGLLQRETRDIPGGFNRKMNRSSQVSLPLPEALPDVNDIRHQASFTIGMFAALSPRPTIKYDVNSRYARGKQPQRPTPLTRPPIVEEGSAKKKRIDELADELDAGGLRELMERDKRRKERKKDADWARLQRKLQRRAEKLKEEEARKARTEEYVSNSASQMTGLGIDASVSRPFTPNETEAGPSARRARTNNDPFASRLQPTSSPVATRNPFDDEKGMDIMHESEPEREPPIPARSPLRDIRPDIVRQSQRPPQTAFSPPISPAPRAVDRQSMSQASVLNRELASEVPESASFDGRASDHSSQKLNSWTAFFRRGTRRKHSSSFQGRSTPSEFSNTSRESFARHGPPPAVPTRTFRRVDSGTPQRAMSKFREDLPEFPISPPDSRMQSPDTTVPVSAGGLSQALAAARVPQESTDEGDRSAYTSSSPIPAESKRPEPKASMELDAPSSAKEMMLSQSLASVDSEGSWLSGKPLNRRSGASQRLKASRSSLTRPMPGGFDGGLDTGRPPESPLAKEFSAEEMAVSTEKGDEVWHSGIGRQPTLIRQASRAKSNEGLPNEYAGKETQESSPGSEDDSHDGPEVNEVTLMRARSVEYKGHARRISAGSAKLLDISRRGSTRSENLLTKAGTSSSQDQLSKLLPAESSILSKHHNDHDQ